MILVVMTLILILVGVVAYFIGAVKLAKYGFRLSTGIGLMVIFFPPYTFYFALKKLEVDGKELPTALCSFGLIVSILLIVIFSHPLGLFVTGQFDEVEQFMSRDEAPSSVVQDEAGSAATTEAPEVAAAEEVVAEEEEVSEEGEETEDGEEGEGDEEGESDGEEESDDEEESEE